MKRLISATLVCLAGLSAAPSWAQGQAPAPGPEHKRLDYFVGKWSGEADLKPSPLGPGGKMTMQETCERFAGGFHLVCRSQGKGPMGELEGLGVLTWNMDRKLYAYFGIDNFGSTDSGTGSVDGKTWTWAGDSKVGDRTLKSRYTVVEESPDTQSMKWEMEEGGTWKVVMEGRSRRLAAGSE